MSTQTPRLALPNMGQKQHITSTNHQWLVGPMLLGSGGSTVTAANSISSGEAVAVKCMLHANFEVNALKQEVEIMQQLRHPNIIELIDLVIESDVTYIVMDRATGDLYDTVFLNGRLPEDRACKYFGQLIEAVSYLHAKRIVHRDIKLENILMFADDSIKLADFGFAAYFESSCTELHQPCGTLKYAAPEILDRSPCYKATPIDIWSAGITLYIMTQGIFPFSRPSATCERFAAVCTGDFSIFNGLSDLLQDLLCRMMTVDADTRILLADIQSHEWLVPETSIISNPFILEEILASLTSEANPSLTSEANPSLTSEANSFETAAPTILASCCTQPAAKIMRCQTEKSRRWRSRLIKQRPKPYQHHESKFTMKDRFNKAMKSMRSTVSRMTRSTS